MFIKKDNSLKYDWIIIACVIVFLLCFLGIIWFDKPLYSFIHNASCSMFGDNNSVLCYIFGNIFGKLFTAKYWLFVLLLLFLIQNIKRFFTQDYNTALKNTFKTKSFYVFSSVFTAVCITGILKVIIGRSRPILFDALDKAFFTPIQFNDVFNSMPSGHTTATFAGLVMIGMLYPKFKWLTWAGAVLVGISRIYVGAHWPTDVLLGAFIGMLSADFIKSWLSKIK